MDPPSFHYLLIDGERVYTMLARIRIAWIVALGVDIQCQDITIAFHSMTLTLCYIHLLPPRLQHNYVTP